MKYKSDAGEEAVLFINPLPFFRKNEIQKILRAHRVRCILQAAYIIIDFITLIQIGTGLDHIECQFG